MFPWRKEKSDSQKNLGESNWWIEFAKSFDQTNIELSKSKFVKRMLDENIERLETIKAGFEEAGYSFNPKNVLDIGNGPCGLLHSFQDAETLVGCDPNNFNYEKAGLLYNPDGKICFFDDISDIKISKKFDFVSCVNVLDHVLNPKQIVKNIEKNTNSQSLIWISVDTRRQEETHVVHPLALDLRIMKKYLKNFKIVKFDDTQKCYDEHPTNKRLDFWLVKK